MLYKLIRSVFFQFDPELIHSIVLGILKFPPFRWLLGSVFGVSIYGKEKKLFGLTFPNPVGLAAGFDKNATALLAWQSLGFGFVEVGTVTPEPQPGNERPRILRFVSDLALVNWMGFNNDGIDCVLERIKRVKPCLKIPVGLNIGKNKDTTLENAYCDYVVCIEKANSVVDFFVINVSSPNTPELRKLQEPERLDHLFDQVMKKATRPVLVKLSPDLTTQNLTQIVWIIKKYKISGIVATNTSVNYSLLPGRGLSHGGMSGKPLCRDSNSLIQKIKLMVGNEIPIIGVGGILSEHDAQEKFALGASLIELYTGFIFEGPGLLRRIRRVAN